MSETIAHGGDYRLRGKDGVRRADRITILDSGWVRVVRRERYQVDYYPPERVASIHTHTSDEQEAEWFDIDAGEDDGGGGGANE